MEGTKKIIACIPAYNEEATIAKVVYLTKKHVDIVLVCDDGSQDLTADLAQLAGATVIRHGRNLGIGAAYRTLFRRALELNADIVVTLDADGQHDPEDIPKVIGPILQGEADVVLGSRFIEASSSEEMPTHRKLVVRLLSSALRFLTGLKVKDTQTGFRAFSRRALEVLRPIRDGYGTSLELLEQAADLDLRVVEVPIRVRYRGLPKTSKKNPLSHGIELIRTLADVTAWRDPLVYLGIPGAISLAIALAFAINVLRLFNRTRYFSLPMTLLGTAFGLFGLILLSTSLTIYAIRKAMYVKPDLQDLQENLETDRLADSDEGRSRGMRSAPN